MVGKALVAQEKGQKNGGQAMNGQPIHDVLIAETKRRLFNESVPRLKKCLGLLTEEEIWQRPNENTVSAGNLVLHLCGNVRQWVLTGLGRAPDSRRRQQEFDEPGPIPAQKLIADLDKLMKEVDSVLDNLDAAALTEKHKVQAYEETGVAILVHVVEHFSYHVGQVSWYVKTRKNIDLKYYKGHDLNRTG